MSRHGIWQIHWLYRAYFNKPFLPDFLADVEECLRKAEYAESDYKRKTHRQESMLTIKTAVARCTNRYCRIRGIKTIKGWNDIMEIVAYRHSGMPHSTINALSIKGAKYPKIGWQDEEIVCYSEFSAPLDKGTYQSLSENGFL